jgi:hypothetical protein
VHGYQLPPPLYAFHSWAYRFTRERKIKSPDIFVPKKRKWLRRGQEVCTYGSFKKNGRKTKALKKLRGGGGNPPLGQATTTYLRESSLKLSKFRSSYRLGSRQNFFTAASGHALLLEYFARLRGGSKINKMSSKTNSMSNGNFMKKWELIKAE